MGLTVLLTLLTSSWSGAQDKGFEERADVLLVQIPVHVTRDGMPIRGLTAEDFEVLEGRKKQSIVAVDVFDLSAVPQTPGGALAAALPAAGRRYFALLFDLSNSSPAGIIRAREAALDLARNGLHPSDLVAVATYSHSKGAELLMGFSTDRLQLEAALTDLGLAEPFERLNDPLRLAIVQREAVMGNTLTEFETGVPDESQGLSETYRTEMVTAMVEQMKDLSTMSSRSNRDQVKQQILDLSGNLDALARLLDSVSGRKQIVLFSEGFDSEIVFGTTDVNRIREIVDSSQFGQTWRVDADERFGASDAQGSLLQMLERFNRSDCAIHTVDTGGLAAGGDTGVVRAGGEDFGGSGALDRGHDGLALMANQTGGEFYRNFNDLTEAMDDLLERTSLTYVISIEPADVAMDGSYHPVKVRLKSSAKGAEISHRPGYYARRPFDELGRLERQLIAAEEIMAGNGGGFIGTEMSATAFPSPTAEAYVLTAIEVDGLSLIVDVLDTEVPVEIYTYAFDAEGRISDYFSQSIILDLDKVAGYLERGFKLLSHLELPQGEYEIRSLVVNARTGRSGLAVERIAVPGFNLGEPVLLPPLFMEPDNRWLVALEERDDRPAPYPLMASDRPMVPASRPRLVGGRPIPMLLVARGLPAIIAAEGHLVGPDGTQRRVDVVVDRRLTDRGNGERLVATLEAPSVPPGDYRLVVTVRGEGREASASTLVSF